MQLTGVYIENLELGLVGNRYLTCKGCEILYDMLYKTMLHFCLMAGGIARVSL